MTTSTKPYLLRALHQWCTDNGHTPYIVVWVNERTDVPREYVQNNEIVLNISIDATKELRIDNDLITFSARFAGVARQVFVPIGNIMSIFARETGEGMGFDVELANTEHLHAVDHAPAAMPGEKGNEPESSDKPKGPPSLRIVK
ncbi:ClpXP protease specificity-enhancing factor [Paludibacterium purpuratum]|uniref:Stringent starvation protein B n=1 Tax=Paludibacterium purpuratum TaxID=1144873 RepID=A0A4R7B8F8_9NEIS|nr:ClpXP protease specificity-enhancing factor [Paludibacterium purpuratum]TDR80162.1 stringent starvation protein B [Paludibacterium purpuratum]